MIQKYINAYLDATMTSFKRYRKLKGGTWYNIVDNSTAGGLQSPATHWSQDKPDPKNTDLQIINTEVYKERL